jgi:hypothetical protein
LKTQPVSLPSSIKCWYPLLNNTSIRQFIRHPSDVPIQVTLDWADDDLDDDLDDTTLTNVSLGGLSFQSTYSLEKDQKVRVSVPLLKGDNSLEGTVVWCESSKTGFEIGLQFESSKEIFRLRMIEQICHIEHYRNEVKLTEGRELSTNEAAKEWISRYAGDFPA